MDFVTILFYIFSLFVVGSAVAVVASRNPVHSVLWLIFAFFNAAGLFILLGAEMLAMLLVIVYVGAVAVLFLFVVMMLNIKTSSIKKGFQAYLPLGLLLAAILFFELTMVIFNSTEKINITKVEPAAEGKKTEVKIETKTENKKPEIKKAEEKTRETPVVEIPAETAIEKSPKITNAQAIGRVLYTEYFLYFQLSGLILLVAMIGAIVLTLRHREGVRKQKTSEQNKRNNSIEIVKVETGKGIG